MAETKKITTKLTAGYSGTGFTRQYKIEDVAESATGDIKSNILSLNASLKAGTDDGMADFYRADDYDDSDPNFTVGRLTGIVAAQTDTVTERVLF